MSIKIKWLAGLLFVCMFTVRAEDNPAPRTYCRFVPERKDDFAWENDKVAFRVYGPAAKDSPENSGIDCWLKRVDYPIVDKWYAQSKQQMSYHKDWGEGHDPYHTGKTRGCGGTALWINEELIIFETFIDWRIVKCETNEIDFVLVYEWPVGEDHYREEKEIVLRMGERLFTAVSTFWKNGEIAPNLPVAIGLATHNGAAAVTQDKAAGWMACWEKINKHGLGTAVVMDPLRIEEIREIRSEKPDESHALIITRTDAEGKVQYRAGYGWERAGDITTPELWAAYLNHETKSNHD